VVRKSRAGIVVYLLYRTMMCVTSRKLQTWYSPLSMTWSDRWLAFECHAVDWQRWAFCRITTRSTRTAQSSAKV